MKKNYLVLLCLLFCSILTVKAQPTTGNGNPTVPSGGTGIFVGSTTIVSIIDGWNTSNHQINTGNGNAYGSFLMAAGANDAGQGNAKLTFSSSIDLNNYQYISVDIWVGSANLSNMSIIATTAGGDKYPWNGNYYINGVQGGTVTPGQWNTCLIPTGSIDNKTLTGLGITITGTNIEGGSVYYDNIYVFSDTPTAPPTPDPSQSFQNVISLYGDTYPTVATLIWGLTEATYGSSNQFKSAKGTGAFQLNSNSNISKMTNLQLDIFGGMEGEITLTLIHYGAETVNATKKVTYSTVGAWQRIDIPLTEFTNFGSIPGQVSVLQFTTSLSAFYIDNVFFYNINPEPAPVLAAANPPARATCTYLSIYNETPYNTPSPISWSVWPDTGSNSSFPVMGVSGIEQMRKINLVPTENVAAEAATDIGINDAGVDLNPYQYLYFDLWLPESKPSGYFEARLHHTSYGVGEDSYGRFILQKITNGGAELPAQQWIPVRLSLEDFELNNWGTEGLTYEDVISSTKELRIYVGGDEANNLFYIDNIYFYSSTQPDRKPDTAPYGSNEVVSIYGQYGYNLSISSWNEKDTFTDPDGNLSAQMSLSSSFSSTIATSSAIPLDVADSNPANMLYLDLWIGENCSNTNEFTIILNGTYTYTVPVGSLRLGTWNTFNIPLKRFYSGSINTINSIQFSGEGMYFVDNIFFYYTELNPVPVAELYIDNMLQGDFYTIREAVSSMPVTGMAGKKIDIAIIQDSNEPVTIDIPVGNWDMLTFYPKDAARTINHTATSGRKILFALDDNVGNVTFNGRVNKTGDSLSLIIKGKYFPSNPLIGDNNVVIGGSGLSNVTIIDCMFEGYVGANANNRPETVFSGSGTHMKLINNHFKDCLFLGKSPNFSNNSVILVYAHESTNYYWEIKGNHFYESAPIYFTAPIFRMYLNFGADDLTTAPGDSTSLKIINNKFGGVSRDAAGNIVDIMKVGQDLGENHDYDPFSDPENTANVQTSSSLFAINMSITNGSGENYALIANNEVANIEMISPTTGMVRTEFDPNDEESFDPDYMGELTGFALGGGKNVIKGNIIHDISNRGLSRKNSTKDRYSYVTLGMRAESWGGNVGYIIEENDIYNVYGDLLYDDADQHGLVSGIDLIQGNSGSGRSTATVRNNRVVMGHKGNTLMDLSISPITSSIRAVNTSGASIQQDIYNNICVLNQISYTRGPLPVYLLNVSNSSNTDNAIVNYYNNIVYVEPKEANSFSGAKAEVAGIRYSSTSGIANVFHNTIFIKDIGMENTNALSLVYEGSDGTVNVWNNNFVNLNEKANIFQVSANGPQQSSQLLLDYNNYYMPTTGRFSQYNGKDISTFDNWKFSNPSPYLDRTTEHDFHSRFLDPDFASTASIDFTTMNGVESLRENLIPKRFLGGMKTPDALFTILPLLTTSVDAHYNLSIDQTTMMSDATNYDFAAKTDDGGALVDDMTVRRINLPTMGALNTSFSNYWVGGTSTNWADAANWNDGKIPGTVGGDAPYHDVVFAESAQGNLLLDGNRTIHDIYNDTEYQLSLNQTGLTVTGYIGQVRADEDSNYAKIDASSLYSTIIFEGLGNGLTTSNIQNPVVTGAAAQHIFQNTFVGNKVNNIALNNQSSYFVLLHGETTEPALTDVTLEIMNDFRIANPSNTAVPYPNEESGIHIGALNCSWYKTNLKFSGYTTGNYPNLSAFFSDYWDDRIEAGQRIPRHGIYNDTIYNLTSNSTKLITYHDKLYIDNQLTIASGKNFEVAADKFVKVTGYTANNAGNAGLLIRSRVLAEPISDTDSTDVYKSAFKRVFLRDGQTEVPPRPNATFIYSNGIGDVNSGAVPATVQMYSLAAYDEVGEEYRWQYFTPAVISPSRSNISGAKNIDVAKWNPQGDIYDPMVGSPYWRWVDNGTLTESDGYTVTQRNPVVYSFTGNLTNTAYNKGMTYYVYPKEYVDEKAWELGYYIWSDQAANNGKYVFGNPYTAALDIRELEFGNNLAATVYIYNAGHSADWRANQNDGNYLSDEPGSDIIVPQKWAGETVPFGGTIGTITFPAFIPSMQGFTITFNDTLTLVDKVTTDTFTMKYDLTAGSESVDKNDSPQRALPKETNMYNMLIELKRENVSDRILLSTRSDCKKGFDNGWDGRKGVATYEKVQLFTVEEEENVALDNSYYQISTMDDINDTWLGIVTDKVETEYQLTFHHTGMDQLYYKIMLEDTVADTIVDITATGSTYSFTGGAAGEINKRFHIITKDEDTNPGDPGTSIDTPDADTDMLKIYTVGKTIYIDNKGGAGTMYIYDITGKCLLINPVKANSKTSADTSFNAGIYLIKLMVGDKQVNQTIILN